MLAVGSVPFTERCFTHRRLSILQVTARIVKGRIERTNLGDLCRLGGRKKTVGF